MSDANATSAAAIDRDNPWPGLATFTEDQAGLFHGRDAEIRDLTKRAERNPLTVLFGQSGLGKSSLLQAGVFPRLRASNYWPIYVRLDHGPGAPTPTEQIKALVVADTARAGTWTKPGSAQPGESLWEFFHHRDDRLIATGDFWSRGALAAEAEANAARAPRPQGAAAERAGRTIAGPDGKPDAARAQDRHAGARGRRETWRRARDRGRRSRHRGICRRCSRRVRRTTGRAGC